MPGPSQPDPMDPSSENEIRRLKENEKDQLSRLNDRLASYIDHVNRLQTENHWLHESIRRLEEKVSIETTTVKSNFQKQTDALRALANDEAKFRATAEAEAQNLQKKLERIILSNKTYKEDLERAVFRINHLETENADLRSKYKTTSIQLVQKVKDLDEARKQLLEAEDRVKTFSVENATLRKRLETVESENRIMKESHEKHIEDIRKHAETEISEIDSRAQARADSHLQSKIEEFRKIYEVEKQELKHRYKQESQQMFSQYVPKQTFEQLEHHLKNLTNQMAKLQSDLEDKKRLLEQERLWTADQLRHKEASIQKANEEVNHLRTEYDHLVDVKEGLQKELDTYRLLLEQEESRLNISSSKSSGRFSFSGDAGTSLGCSTPMGRKRRRLSSGFESAGSHDTKDIEVTSESLGALKIAAHDVKNGKFIVVENLSDCDLNLGRWKIVQQCGNLKASHRFPLGFTIKAKSKITLWSADSGQKHAPPVDFVLKKIVFPWKGPGDTNLSTTISNLKGEKVASRMSRLHSFSTGYFRKSQNFSGMEGISDEDLVDSQAMNLDESSCCVS